MTWYHCCMVSGQWLVVNTYDHSRDHEQSTQRLHSMILNPAEHHTDVTRQSNIKSNKNVVPMTDTIRGPPCNFKMASFVCWSWHLNVWQFDLFREINVLTVWLNVSCRDELSYWAASAKKNWKKRFERYGQKRIKHIKGVMLWAADVCRFCSAWAGFFDLTGPVFLRLSETHPRPGTLLGPPAASLAPLVPALGPWLLLVQLIRVDLVTLTCDLLTG